jgi:hypothetical protein
LTTLRIESYNLPAAELGPENPLPVFRAEKVDGERQADDSVPAEDKRYIGWQTGQRVLPHRMQDEYSRARAMRAFRAAVLENEFLRATFLPELGGHLASLVYKPNGRELLERNPAFQPANLALRNAWWSGGIEWNVSHPGHHYLTCSPVFAARVTGNGADPVLRLYEWDRVKRFPWQLDFHLASGSRFLYLRGRVINPHEYAIPMYWWTNIGVAELPGARTLVPADETVCHDRTALHFLKPLPHIFDTDISYATQVPFSNSFFFRIPDGQRRWVAVLDEQGAGFVETSTDTLRGRKMFAWGMGQGGRRWQEYLSMPGHAYLEIQAGVARTQMECLPLPAHTEWTWTEAFGFLQADRKSVHSRDWSSAWRAADEALEASLPRQSVEQADRQFAALSRKPVDEVLHTGSGWGALERKRAAADGERDGIPQELPFDSATLGPDQAPWLGLLTDGALPESETPGSFMVQPEWHDRLQKSVESGRSDHWLGWLHLGTMRLEAFDKVGARQAWEKCLAIRRTGWALRNLSVLAAREGRHDESLDLLRQAWEAGPKVAPLAVEYVRGLAQAKDKPVGSQQRPAWQVLSDFVRSLPGVVRSHERLQLLAAEAMLKAGDLAFLESLFERDLAAIREGEVTLTDLWFALRERKLAAKEGLPLDDALRARVRREFPPPSRIDFRMR